MRRNGFDYEVCLMVEISGKELLFLQQLSERHYDGACRAAGAHGGFLYGFINQWKFGNPEVNGSSDRPLDELEEIRMTGRQVDMLAKICEAATSGSILSSADFVKLLHDRNVEYQRIMVIA